MRTQFVLLLYSLTLPFCALAGDLIDAPGPGYRKMAESVLQRPAQDFNDVRTHLPEHRETFKSPEKLTSESGSKKNAAADELFLEAYGSAKDGDRMRDAGQADAAIVAYQKTLGILDGLHNKFPDWNSTIVRSYRQQIIQSLKTIQAAPGSEPQTKPER
jgi:ferric-dicitrate binding protein FerR (iron transport regulator)